MSTGLKFLTSVIENQAGSALLRVDSDLFIDEEVQAYSFMIDYYRRYREAPTTRIVQEETGIRLPRAEGALAFHLENLHDRQVFEILREGYADYREAITAGEPGPTMEALEHTLRRVRRRTRSNGSMLDIGQGVDQVTARLRRVQGMGGLSGVPTPWETLNEISAGYQRGDLITYVGRTGMGKTQTLLWQAEHAFETGYSALFVTTEMSSEQIARRWIAMKLGIDGRVLKSGMISTRLLRYIESFNGSLLGRERFRLLSVGTGAQMSLVEAAVEEMMPDIVYLDGAYLMRPREQGLRSTVEKVSAVFDEIKQDTIDQDIPYVVNTQFNRQAGRGGREGSLETIGMSDTIARHSSIVVAVKPGPTDNPMDSRELDLLKGREGEIGSININYLFKPTDLSEMTAEQMERVNGRAPEIGADGDWN